MTVNEQDTQTVSIIIPTYYRNERLTSAVQSSLDQDYENIQIVVVDDSGEAYARPVVEQFDEIEYIPKESNDGPQAARTLGIQRAHGDFIQLLDDDDRLCKGKIQQQAKLLEESDTTGVAYCGFTWDNGTTVLPKKQVKGDVLKQTLMFNTAPCITSTMLIEKSTLEQCLPLVDRPGADDTGLKIELAKQTEFDYIDESLVFRAESPNSRQASSGKVEGQKQILREYRELYKQFPPAVYQTAVAETYLIDGLEKLDDKFWSLTAILLLGKACYYMPRFSLPVFGAFAASLLGRPGRDLGLRVLQIIRGNDRRGKSF